MRQTISPQAQIIHVDCDSFFASCEQLFRPDLRDRAVVVLSSNDGCVVAANRIARQLGVRRGEAWFKQQLFLHGKDITLFSSNFVLYSSLSRRVMRLLEELCPAFEHYSIDEAFLHSDAAHAAERAAAIHHTVPRQIGLPVSVGVGRTKTLAKAATHVAKRGDGLCAPTLRQEAALLDTLKTGEIWNIGPRTAATLERYGISSAAQLRECDEAWIAKHFGIFGLRTLWELRGIANIDAEFGPRRRKGILCSLSFARATDSLKQLQRAVAQHVDRAVEKLIAQGSLAAEVGVFINTNRFGIGYYHNSHSIHLEQPSNFLPDFARAAQSCLAQIYRPQRRYIRSGVFLGAIDPPDRYQLDLFRPPDRRTQRMTAVVQELRRRWGRQAIATCRGLGDSDWITRSKYRSPRYTTSWDELPLVH